MNKLFILIIAVTTIVILQPSCKKEEDSFPLKQHDNLKFSGTFKTIDSYNQSGTVELSLSGGHYTTSTNQPFGIGAGKLEIDKTTINFIDTLFFTIPAVYGPSYVPSGKFDYNYNGSILEIWKKKNVGEIKYILKMKMKLD